MSRYIDADEQMTRIKQVYESMGVDTHGIWNKQLAEAFKGSDVETIRMCLHAILGAITQAPSIDIVRCKECRWYDPPHILHKDGTRTDVDEGSPWVTVDVGINCGGQCIHHIDLKTYCVNHDRENPDDNERIVIFRSPDDFCSYGVKKGADDE